MVRDLKPTLWLKFENQAASKYPPAYAGLGFLSKFFCHPGCSALLSAPSHMTLFWGKGPLTLHCDLEAGYGVGCQMALRGIILFQESHPLQGCVMR